MGMLYMALIKFCQDAELKNDPMVEAAPVQSTV